MRAVVVDESMFATTCRVAEPVEVGLGSREHVEVIGAADAGPRTLEAADWLVVGGPTHARSMSRPTTGPGAPDDGRRSHGGLTLEPGADAGPGVRVPMASLGQSHDPAAGLDTGIKVLADLSGRASGSVRVGLARHGLNLVVPAESFLVDRTSHWLDADSDRARAWWAHLARTVQRQRSEER